MFTGMISGEMYCDLSVFLPVFNGTATCDHYDIDFGHTLAMDACLQGVGVYGTTMFILAISLTI